MLLFRHFLSFMSIELERNTPAGRCRWTKEIKSYACVHFVHNQKTVGVCINIKFMLKLIKSDWNIEQNFAVINWYLLFRFWINFRLIHCNHGREIWKFVAVQKCNFIFLITFWTESLRWFFFEWSCQFVQKIHGSSVLCCTSFWRAYIANKCCRTSSSSPFQKKPKGLWKRCLENCILWY